MSLTKRVCEENLLYKKEKNNTINLILSDEAIPDGQVIMGKTIVDGRKINASQQALR